MVDKNALSLDFVIVLVGEIVYYMDFALVVVVLENLVGFQEIFCFVEYVVAFDVVSHVNMVQKYLVNGHRQMIHIPCNGFFGGLFLFCWKKG